MRQLGIAAAIAAGCLGLLAWREISALNSAVSQTSAKLEKVEIESLRHRLRANLHDPSVNTFGGYICSDYCEKHFSGFSWASYNNVKNEADCAPLPSLSYQGCLVYLHDKLRSIEIDDPFDRKEILPPQNKMRPPS